MKLCDLNPRWIGHGEPIGQLVVGISFDSPTNGQRLALLFRNPIDPQAWLPRTGMKMEEAYRNSPLWHRAGDSFETLTLEPSVNFSPSNWHGFIRDGEVINA